MQSIYKKFNVNDPKSGAPIDLLKTMNIMFDEASKTGKTLWEQTYADRWFTTNAPQFGLTAEGIVGKYNLRFMASIINNDSSTPLRPSDGFDDWKGEIPRMGHKFFTSVKKLRRLKEIEENPRLSDVQKYNEIKKAIITEYKEAYLGTKDVADHIILRALSNYGIADFTTDINPDGRKYKLDYEMPAENKLKVELEWTEANIAKIDIVKDMERVREVIEGKSLDFSEYEILMAPKKYAFLKRLPLLKKAIFGTDKSSSTITDGKFKEFWEGENGFPPIILIKKKNRQQEDGEDKIINPWNEDMICFKPTGMLGEIQPAFEDNEIIEEENVEYSNAGQGIRMAKWRVGESTGQKAGEYTQGSWRAVPIVNAINAVVNMQINNIVEPVVDNEITE